MDGGGAGAPQAGEAGERRIAERVRALAAAGALEVPAACVHCRAAAPRPWGRTRAGAPRLRCGACRRTFTAAAGTLLERVRLPEKLRLVLENMLSAVPSSCRRLAARLGLDRMTVWRWRRRIARWLGSAAAREDEGEAAAVVTLRESRKASREWVRHERDPARYPRPDRLRWYEYPRLRLPPPDGPRYRVPVLLMAEPAGGLRAETGRPPRTRAPGAGADQPGGEPGSCFERFIRRFRGPATRHLAGYLAWFGAWAAAVAATAPLPLAG